MSSHIRQKQLLDYVNEHSVATVQQLVSFLNCSPATIRRDIHDLDQEGKLSKIRNGAEKILSPKYHDTVDNYCFYPRISDYHDYYESDRIARQAVDLCRDRDVIFVASGSTCFLMGKHVLDKTVQVHSNCVQLFSYLISESYSHLYIVGGQYIRNQQLLVSPDKPYPFQGRYLFIEADGLSEMGVTKSTVLTYMEEKRALEYFDKIVVLAPTDTIGQQGGVPLLTLEEIDIVITGKAISPKILDRLAEHNVEVFPV